MTRASGMTIEQFNEIIKDMRKIYPFKDKDARLVNVTDLNCNEPCQIELYVKDADTGVSIVMTKGCERTYD